MIFVPAARLLLTAPLSYTILGTLPARFTQRGSPKVEEDEETLTEDGVRLLGRIGGYGYRMITFDRARHVKNAHWR